MLINASTPRERQEQWELHHLADWAAKSAQSKGRARPEEPDPVRTAYQRDRDRILHSKAFRRLKHKTQVFIDPEEDHFRTRLTHTLEVTQIARTIARALSLNEDLTEAIALAHDLGTSSVRSCRAKRHSMRRIGSLCRTRDSSTMNRVCALWIFWKAAQARRFPMSAAMHRTDLNSDVGSSQRNRPSQQRA